MSKSAHNMVLQHFIEAIEALDLARKNPHSFASINLVETYADVIRYALSRTYVSVKGTKQEGGE